MDSPNLLLKKFIKSCLPEALIVRIGAFRAPKCSRGRKVYLAPDVQMIGAAHITIGDNSCISERSWFNVNHRHEAEIAIEIGDNCFIGRNNFFSSGKKIEIGPYVLTTIDCKFICCSHVITDPMLPYMTTGTTSGDAIRVGPNCFFGAGSSVVGNISIGHGSVIGAGSQVTKDVPPFSIVIGSPARVIKRYSFSKNAWIDTDSISESDVSGHPDEANYLAQLRAKQPALEMPLIAASAHLGNL